MSLEKLHLAATDNNLVESFVSRRSQILSRERAVARAAITSEMSTRAHASDVVDSARMAQIFQNEVTPVDPDYDPAA